MEQKVRYTLEVDGRLYAIDKVPTRVNVETVERLHEIIRGRGKPVRVVETLVFDYEA